MSTIVKTVSCGACGHGGIRRHIQLHWRKHLMMLPCLCILGLFNYVPMVGIVMAFQNFFPTNGFFGSPWVGMKWFEYMFSMSNFTGIVRNTLIISMLKLVTSLSASVIFALMLNELRVRALSRSIQSMVLFPFFISWVVCAGILRDIVSESGIINQAIFAIFGTNVSFLTSQGWFMVLLIVSNVWKDVGYNAIIIMAALSVIDPALYESASIDGATRFQKMRYITFPGISQIVVMLAILALGGVLNGGFDQIYNLYNTTVMSVADIIDTYVYRMGINNGLYSLGTAVGLFKSAVGAVLLASSYWAAKRYAGYRIF